MEIEMVFIVSNRLQTALVAGKKRVFDLIPQKRRSGAESSPQPSVDGVEMGTEAGELSLDDEVGVGF